ncbi:helix-turn-helix domain-containing protein [Streptococcus suis]|uniref:helix-turn-helix domain-containing protein n=1 Tax=Streptococcus suis TaxID=1307 RepID=UPI0037577709
MKISLLNELIMEIMNWIEIKITSEVENQINNRYIENSYMNKKQACEYLGISNNTLDSWIKQGLPSIKIGKTVRFNKQAIDAWLLSQN